MFSILTVYFFCEANTKTKQRVIGYLCNSHAMIAYVAIFFWKICITVNIESCDNGSRSSEVEEQGEESKE